MVDVLDPQDSLTPNSEEYEEPIQRKYSLEWAREWANNLNKTSQQQKDNNSLITFLTVVAICVVLIVWIFGQASSPSSNDTTTKASEPSSSQNEDTTTKPTLSPENGKPATSAPEAPDQTETTTTQKPSNSANSTPSYENVCIHYEYGRCWDDLEDKAYDAGRWDGSYGYYGDSYYEGDNCDDLCQSIMEGAYDEGYYDY